MRIKIQTNAKLVRKGLEDLRAEVPKIARSRMYAALLHIQKRMKKPGKPVAYPINWDSEKQRRYVMAMLRKNDNLPYKRTGRYQRAYRIRALPKGHELINPLPHSQYIGGNSKGERQSKIHKGRWPVLREEVDKELEKLPKTVVEHLKVYARKKGFKTR